MVGFFLFWSPVDGGFAVSEPARPSVVNARQRLEVVEFECPRTVAEPIVYHRSLRVVNRFAVMVFDGGGG